MLTSQQNMKKIPEFTKNNDRISALLERMHEIADLKALVDLASWDQNTALPPAAGELRGLQMATLQGVMHERWLSPELPRLLDNRLRGNAHQGCLG